MARKKTAAESQNESQPGKLTTGSKHQTITKAAAVRNALAAGKESPGDIADFALSNYGLEIGKSQVSAYKSMAKKKEASKSQRGPRLGAAPLGGGAGSAVENGIVGDIAAVKDLVTKLGGDQVKKIVDLFD